MQKRSEKTNSLNKAVFLDRDQTIIEDNEGYLNNPAKVKLLPGAAQAIKTLNENGFKVIITTNQSGIARGYFTEDDLQKIHDKMLELLKREGALINAIYHCPHHPDANCTCRKPLPGMIIQAAIEHEIDLKQSYLVGDNESDVQAGINAGCKKTILISENPNQKSEADFIVGSLAEAVEILSTSRTSNIRI